jgi:hypothetical protein
MTRLAVGFLLGLSVGTALAALAASADSMLGHDIGYALTEPIGTPAPAAGVDPDNRMAPIQVDPNGYVICSDKSPRR